MLRRAGINNRCYVFRDVSGVNLGVRLRIIIVSVSGLRLSLRSSWTILHSMSDLVAPIALHLVISLVFDTFGMTTTSIASTSSAFASSSSISRCGCIRDEGTAAALRVLLRLCVLFLES
jgi:hypothetical protein